MFKGFSTQDYLAEFSKRDLAGWSVFQAEVLAAGETANGDMVVRHMMSTLAGLSEKMRQLTEQWYRDVMRTRSARQTRDFGFQGERGSENKKVILDDWTNVCSGKFPCFRETHRSMGGGILI